MNGKDIPISSFEELFLTIHGISVYLKNTNNKISTEFIHLKHFYTRIFIPFCSYLGEPTFHFGYKMS